MKHVLFILAIAIVVSVACAGVSHAATFSNAIDFSGAGTLLGETYRNVNDSYIYTHTVTFDVTAVNVSSATLRVTHKGSSADGISEIWFASANGGDDSSTAVLGELLYSNGPWVTQDFALSSDLFDGIQNANTWNVSFRLNDTTAGADNLKVTSSLLFGDYVSILDETTDPDPDTDPSTEPVPEPASLFIFGSGLVGLALKGKKLF